MDSLEKIVAEQDKGETTSDEVLKRRVLREVIYKQSNLISVGTNIIPEREFGVMDVDFGFPSELEGEYPVGENSIVDREKMTWQEFDLSLEQAEVRYMITDMAKVRGQGQFQNEWSARRAAEAIAKKKDWNIINTLLGGAPTDNVSTLDRGADEGWDQSGSPENDIVETWGNIFQNSNVNEEDAERSHVVVPSGVYAILNKLQMIQNTQQRLRDYIEGSFGVSIHFSRFLDDTGDALVVVGGEQTAIHGVYDGSEIDLVEEQREMGRGDDRLIRQFFNTAVVEDEGLDGESYRIAKIENVASTA